MTKPSPRADVEARLEEAQNSITQRLSSLENEVKVPKVVALQQISPVRAKKMGLAVVAGLIAAWGASRLFRPARAGDGSLAEDMSEDIAKLVEDGYDLDAAVRRAVRRNAIPATKESKSGGGLLAALVMLIARTGLNAAVRGYVDRASSEESEE